MGVIFQVTSGASTSASPPGLAELLARQDTRHPDLALIAIVAILIVAGVMRSTVVGRRFVAVGASPAAARAAGLRVEGLPGRHLRLRRHHLRRRRDPPRRLPGHAGIGAGNNYLLPTIAAVVLGGTSLVGGVGSVIATAAARCS